MEIEDRSARSRRKNIKEDLEVETGHTDSDMQEEERPPHLASSVYDHKVTAYKINEIAPFVATDRIRLALYLHMENSVVSNIESNHPMIEDRCREILIKWMHFNGSSATELLLAKALAKLRRTDIIEKLTGDQSLALFLVSKECEEPNNIILTIERNLDTCKGEAKCVKDPVTGKRYLLCELKDDEQPYLQSEELPGLLQSMDLTINSRLRQSKNNDSQLESLKSEIDIVLQSQRKCMREHILSSCLKTQAENLSKLYDTLSELCGQCCKPGKSLFCQNNLKRDLRNLYDKVQNCEIFYEAEIKKLMSAHSHLSEEECTELNELQELQQKREAKRILVQTQLSALCSKDGKGQAPVRHSTPLPSQASGIFSRINHTMRRTLTEGTASLQRKIPMSCPWRGQFDLNETDVASPIEGNDSWISVVRADHKDDAVCSEQVTSSL